MRTLKYSPEDCIIALLICLLSRLQQLRLSLESFASIIGRRRRRYHLAAEHLRFLHTYDGNIIQVYKKESKNAFSYLSASKEAGSSCVFSDFNYIPKEIFQ